MIIDLQRRIAEVGRIRIGQQVSNSNGKTRPVKLETFRLTSPDRARIDRAAQLYGGTPSQWDAPAGKQWEVVTTADALAVIVPPSEMAFSQHYETWSAGGCQRRCDGVTESIGDRPCVCDPDVRECDIHTRLSVMLRDLPGLGVWRIDTSGYYAAVELGGAVQVIQTTAGRGAMLPAKLRLEQRAVKRIGPDGKSATRRFAVPVLDIEVSPAQLLADEREAPLALAAGDDRTPVAEPARPPLTPVPAELPTGPGLSIAEQSAPPAPRPKRANAAPEIPASGRQRKPDTSPAPDPEPEVVEPEQPPADPNTPGSITRAQSQHLHAIFTEAQISSRETKLAISRKLVGRDELESSKNLSKAEATSLIDALKRMSEGGDLAIIVAELLDRGDGDGTEGGQS